MSEIGASSTLEQQQFECFQGSDSSVQGLSTGIYSAQMNIGRLSTSESVLHLIVVPFIISFEKLVVKEASSL